MQIDDGYQAEIGDWLTPVRPVRLLARHRRPHPGAGRRAGIWVAPFFVGERSATLAEHPEWLIGGADPGHAAGTSSCAPST